MMCLAMAPAGIAISLAQGLYTLTQKQCYLGMKCRNIIVIGASSAEMDGTASEARASRLLENVLNIASGSLFSRIRSVTDTSPFQ